LKGFLPSLLFGMWEIIMTENLEKKVTARDCHTRCVLTAFAASGNVRGTHDAECVVCWKFWADNNVLIYTQCQELVKSVGRHGS
jgi:hypothetical protein